MLTYTICKFLKRENEVKFREVEQSTSLSIVTDIEIDC